MFKLYFTMKNAGYQRKEHRASFGEINFNLVFPPIANVSTYNYLLMALDHSECSTAWEIAMELVKNMACKPVVLPDTSLNLTALFLLVIFCLMLQLPSTCC